VSLRIHKRMTQPMQTQTDASSLDAGSARSPAAWGRFVHTLTRELPPDELFEQISRDLVAEFGFARSIIATVDRRNHRLVARAGYDPNIRTRAYLALVRLFQIPLAPRPDGRLLLAAWCVQNREQAYVPDARFDSFRPAEVTQRPLMIKALGLTEYVVTPIVYENRTVAIIGVDKKGTGQRITTEEQRLLRDIAGVLALRLGPLLDAESGVTADAATSELLAVPAVRGSERRPDQGEQLRSVLHDLLAPVQSMIGFAELLQTGRVGELTAEQKEFVSRIVGGGEELLRFIDRLLTMQALEAVEQEPGAPVSAAAVVEQVFGRLNGKALHANVRLAHGLNGETLRGDATRFAAVFQNLVDNAIDSAEPGGAVRVDALEHADPGYAHFRVSQDAAPGTDAPDMLSFEENWTDAGARRRRRSHGLGLAIVRRIVEAYGGEIWAQAGGHEELVVSFTLPAARGEADHMSEALCA
jgi:signal transduction histidine kinase